ncbi:hypothetical protein BN128_3940 [Cronobacter sakazakii 696]|nr:hypothetical protein BN128_3940 [Cronobacter sakazakii 696]
MSASSIPPVPVLWRTGRAVKATYNAVLQRSGCILRLTPFTL